MSELIAEAIFFALWYVTKFSHNVTFHNSTKMRNMNLYNNLICESHLWLSELIVKYFENSITSHLWLNESCNYHVFQSNIKTYFLKLGHLAMYSLNW